MKKFISVNIEPIWFDDDISFFDHALDSPSELIICTLLWESPSVAQWQHRLSQLISRAKSVGKTVIIIMNSWFQKDKEILIKCGADDIVFVDFFLMLVYVRLIKNQESDVRIHWDPDSKNWLFLRGKADKPNRLPLLYRFYQDQLLERCHWSLFVTDRIYQRCRQYLSDLSNDEAKKWLEKFSQSPDGVDVADSANGTHYSGIPYDGIYQSCLFQIVSETSVHKSNPWITEKTWLPVVNRTPFLIFGDPCSNAKLRHMGFLTFDEFLYDDNFDRSLEWSHRVDSVINNIRYWLDNLSKNTAAVTEIVEHNHHRFLELANKNIKILTELHRKHNMEKDIYSLVDFKDAIQHAQWKNWYARIKDPTWPDCDREQDFHKLPKWIQKECIEVFGYQYKGPK